MRLGSLEGTVNGGIVAEQKTHFPQIPLEEVKQIVARHGAGRRPASVVVQQRKGSDPYSIKVSAESNNGSRALGSKK